MAIPSIRGFRDILPPESSLWQEVERIARAVLEGFGYAEIKTPLLERTDLFARSIGATTDIVEKEMYSFVDTGGESVTLRPEATAGIVRAYIEHRLHGEDAVAKVYCMGPMFRRERPQKGRLRQFHQIDVEILGTAEAMADAEVLHVLDVLVATWGVTGLELHLNSLGCSTCRPAYRATLQAHIAPRLHAMCEDCQRRHAVNPMRLLDCKKEPAEVFAEAPLPAEHLCAACREHFARVRSYLDLLGTRYVLNPRLVRGLDYYTRTTFELVVPSGGAQNAVAAGGRYDGLVRELGGPDIPGLGFAIGMERLVALVPERRAPARRLTVFVAPLIDAARAPALLLAADLARAGIPAHLGYEGKSLKSQMRRADKLGCRFVLMLGEEEIEQGTVTVRDMRTKRQEALKRTEVGDSIRRLAGERRA